jgi:hypothetical protein
MVFKNHDEDKWNGRLIDQGIAGGGHWFVIGSIFFRTAPLTMPAVGSMGYYRKGVIEMALYIFPTS